jgi:hypothetical protein
MPDQYLGYRCEVQAPKTILYPMEIDLGTFYVGIPLHFDITTENICNLPTSYTFERPGSASGTAISSTYKLTFDKPSGPLGPKDKVIIHCEFVALQAGTISDELIANKIRGVPDPLGFLINGRALPPLADSFPLDGSIPSQNIASAAISGTTSHSISRRGSEVTGSTTAGAAGKSKHKHMPLPIASPNDVKYPHTTPVPEALNGKAIIFSSSNNNNNDNNNNNKTDDDDQQEVNDDDEVALYERCVQHFALRNLSAVPLSFELNVEKFGVAGDVGVSSLSGAQNDMKVPTRTANRTMSRAGSMSSKINQGPLLTAHEDGANKFHSVMGQKHAEASVQRNENRLFLKSGLGASYLVSNDSCNPNLLSRPILGGIDVPDAPINDRVGYLDPWGVALITIRTFNDMPGNYDDHLMVQFKDLLGLSWGRQQMIPLKMHVTGCPLVIDKSTYGMTKEKLTVLRGIDDPPVPVPAVPVKARDMLSFGFAPFNSTPITRELYVQNNGSMPGMVNWKIREVIKEKMNGPLRVTLDVGEGEMVPATSPTSNVVSKTTSRASSKEGSRPSSRPASGEGSDVPANDADELELDSNVEPKTKEIVKVTTNVEFWSDLVKNPPFTIEPTSATIVPYGKQKFKVTLFRTNGEKEDEDVSIDAVRSELIELADLIGEVKFVPQEDNKPNANATTSLTASISGLEGVELIDTTAFDNENDNSLTLGQSRSADSTLIPRPSPASQIYRLNMLLQARLVNPTIVMDKRTLIASSNETVLSMEEGGIKFKTDANNVFGLKNNHGKRGGMGNGESKACHRIVTFRNPTETTLVCSVSTEGQFMLKLAADDSNTGRKAVSAADDKVAMSKTGPGAIRTPVGSDTNGKIVTLLPQASASFVVSFQPSRNMRQTITTTKQATAALGSNDEEGNLIISFNTGQRLFLPLLASISTPFLVGSSPKLFFGTCKVGFTTDGTMLLSNPTGVLARWVVKHVPIQTDPKAIRKRENDLKRIKVPGYEYPAPETDDPTVFIITPSAGQVTGPTVSTEAAINAPPKDLNRGGDVIEVVPLRPSEASWAKSTLTLKDTMDKRHKDQGQFEADACFPLPITVLFKPKGNKKYASRFRFTCEYGNFFDVLLRGNGTFEEHEHEPLQPKPI